MTPAEEGGATVLPPPGDLPEGTEPRDTLTPDQEALARHVATLVVAAIEPRLDAFDTGIGSILGRLEALEAAELAKQKSLDAVHEQLGREVIRTEGVRKALGTLANDMLELNYISGKARGEVADALALMPKPPSHAPAPEAAKADGGE